MSTPTTQVSDYTTLEDWSKDQAVQGNRSYADWLWSTGAVKDATSQYPVWVVPCEIRSTTNNAGTLLTIDNDAEAQIALSIEAANTTATVISAVACDSLTTGGIAAFTSNSSSTAVRALVNVKNDNTLAVEAIPIVAENDSTSVCLQALSNAAGAVGAQVELNTKSASAADNDVTGRILFKGDSEDGTPTNCLLGQIDCVMLDATAASFGSRIEMFTSTSAGQVEVIRLLGNGTLEVNVSHGATDANTGLFDDHDDPMVLAMMSTDPVGFKAWLTAEGIMTQEPGRDDMIQLQPMLRLMSGGIYQNRWRMDEQFQTMSSRIESLETTLASLGEGRVIDVEETE